jgi:hypothetical protein
MILQSNVDLHLLNELLPFSSVFLPLFPVFNCVSFKICFYSVPPSVYFGILFVDLPEDNY